MNRFKKRPYNKGVMLNRVSSFFLRLSTGPVTIATLAIFLLFVSLVMPRQAAQAKIYTKEAGSPDMSFYYSVDDLNRMRATLKQNGIDTSLIKVHDSPA